MVEKRRSVWEKLTGKNEMSESDELLQTVREILQAEPGFEKLRFEEAAPKNAIQKSQKPEK